MADDEWISAEAACQRLGVRPQTLYAYVSRNPVQVRADPSDPRRSLYHVADIAVLAKRKTRSRRVADVAALAIAWGEPVLESAITTVAHGRLFYRGRDAVLLAETETLESVARLLRGEPDDHIPGDPPVLSASWGADDNARVRVLRTLALRAAMDLPLQGRASRALDTEAAQLLHSVADAIAGAPGTDLIHRRLARGWGQDPDGPAADLTRRLLVLTADHELNPSAFAARVTASTGASLAACATAGLTTLSGPRHRGAFVAGDAFVEEAARLGGPEAVSRRLRDDLSLPGFGHKLYPEGDPRAAAVLHRIPDAQSFLDLAEMVEDIAGLRPTIDFALVAACRSMNLPTDAPFQIFTAARCAGWIAHAIEQAQGDSVIRPRARYSGPALDAR